MTSVHGSSLDDFCFHKYPILLSLLPQQVLASLASIEYANRPLKLLPEGAVS